MVAVLLLLGAAVEVEDVVEEADEVELELELDEVDDDEVEVLVDTEAPDFGVATSAL